MHSVPITLKEPADWRAFEMKKDKGFRGYAATEEAPGAAPS